MNSEEPRPELIDAALSTVRSLTAAEDYTAALRILSILRKLGAAEQEIAGLITKCQELEEKVERLRDLRLQARKRLDEEKYPEAYELWEKILALMPGDREALHCLQGLRRILQSRMEVRYRIREIRMVFADGDYDHALKLLRQLPVEESFRFDLQEMYQEILRARSDRDYAERLHQCALRSTSAGNLPEALAYWVRVLDLLPDHREALRMRVDVREDLAKNEEDRIRQGWLLHAQRELTQGNLERAKEMCDRALALWPRDVSAKTIASDVAEQLARRQEFIQLVSAGDDLYRREKYDSAIHRWEMALELDPDNSDLEQQIKQAKALLIRQDAARYAHSQSQKEQDTH